MNKLKEFNTEKFFQNKSSVLFLAIVCTLLWGSAFPIIKIGYEIFNISESDLPSKLLFAGLRFTLAGFFVLLFFYFINKTFPLFKKENFHSILAVGLIQTTLQYFLIYYGLFYTSGIKSNILNSVSVFIMVILAHFIYKNDKLSKNKIIGCLSGFLGVIIINLGSSTGGSSNFLGDLCMILGATSFAIGSILSKKVASSEDSIIVTGYQLFLGGLVLLFAGLIGGAKLELNTFFGVYLLLYLALLSSVAFTIWTTLFKYNPVGRISIYNFLNPLFGTLFSAAILHEKILEVKNIIALILVCIGIYIVNKPKNEIKEIKNLA